MGKIEFVIGMTVIGLALTAVITGSVQEYRSFKKDPDRGQTQFYKDLQEIMAIRNSQKREGV
jgi:hypothetical protein